jgi:hypothetical protein
LLLNSLFFIARLISKNRYSFFPKYRLNVSFCQLLKPVFKNKPAGAGGHRVETGLGRAANHPGCPAYPHLVVVADYKRDATAGCPDLYDFARVFKKLCHVLHGNSQTGARWKFLPVYLINRRIFVILAGKHTLS